MRKALREILVHFYPRGTRRRGRYRQDGNKMPLAKLSMCIVIGDDNGDFQRISNSLSTFLMSLRVFMLSQHALNKLKVFPQATQQIFVRYRRYELTNI